MNQLDRRGMFLVTLAAPALLLACSDDPPPVCGDGTELVAGECLPIEGEGASNRDGGEGPSNAGGGAQCGGDTVEQDGTCEGLEPIGAACERGRECASGTCLPESQGLPGGYCSVLDCNANRPCPAGAICRYAAKADHFVCLAYCDDDEDCRAGDYVCQSLILNDLSVCAPACKTNADCPNPTACDSATGHCVLDECDPASSEPCNPAGDHVCYPDSRGLTTMGGVCLLGCDPADAAASCADDELCQPLPEDPEHTGFCTPPLCTETADCPAGASCVEGVCHPPARCDGDGACADSSTVCIGGAGGQCLPACPSDDLTCADLHPGLACETTSGACLPIGSFPGGPCRDQRSKACDPLRVSGASGPRDAPMVCREERCLVDCGAEGSTLCSDVAASLTCADGIYDVPVCLPRGAFPGGPCDESGQCAPLARDTGAVAMTCVQDRCAVVCDASASATGDGLCGALDPSLVCADDLFGDGLDLCLPRGSFPGGPCAAANRCDSGMSCQGARCLYDCATGGSSACEAIRADLTCAEDVYDAPVCLPKGAFPGGPCADGNACAPLEQGGQSLPMACRADKCLLTCDSSAGGDAFCAAIDGGLVCADNLYGDGVDLCLPRGSFPGGPCGAGNACDSGMVCKGARCLYDCTTGGSTLCGAISSTLACAPAVYDVPVCLPKGSFPGGPCDAGGACAQDLGGLSAADMRCQQGVCVVDCSDEGPFASGDALCGAVNSALTCVDSAQPPFCSLECGSGCAAGTSCLSSQQACLPTGSFLGSPCVSGGCSGSPNLVCTPANVCAAGCNTANGTMQAQADGYCTSVGNALGTGFDKCVAVGGGVEVCADAT